MPRVCVGGGGGASAAEIGAVPPDGRKRCYRVLIGRCDRSRCAPHHKSRPILGQGLEVRVGAHARKRHVSTIRDVGRSRVDVYVVPGRCDVRSLDP